MITDHDLLMMQRRGISPDTVDAQLKRFVTGFPYLILHGSATPGHGITVMDADTERQAVERWHRYLADGGEVCKFVPASGAASRMFKSLFGFVNGDTETPGKDVQQVLDNIQKMPFADELNKKLLHLHGKEAAALIAEGRNKDVVSAIVSSHGLNYGQLPKGLLSFHAYPQGPRTPLEEQLMEGAQTAASGGLVRVHFTVSPEHRVPFTKKVEEAVPAIEALTGKKIEVTFSEQHASTDTIAANPDGTPFRKEDGNLLFRPGGHGALISNLGDIDSAVVFIKNIDNVVPDWRRADTVRYKEILAGYLIMVHDTMASMLHQLNDGHCTPAQLEEMRAFTQKVLCIEASDAVVEANGGMEQWLRGVFNRPLRVCGMVRNEGEPGGGPYIAVNPDGTASPQILESTQIDTTKPENAQMMQQATHFNPVDLVCYIKDIDGNRFNLTRFVDPDTGFISSKSQGGRELQALELPGLWNGAMSNWNTVFVEVPISTFNPVKTVNDLLRPVHQPE